MTVILLRSYLIDWQNSPLRPLADGFQLVHPLPTLHCTILPPCDSLTRELARRKHNVNVNVSSAQALGWTGLDWTTVRPDSRLRVVRSCAPHDPLKRGHGVPRGDDARGTHGLHHLCHLRPRPLPLPLPLLVQCMVNVVRPTYFRAIVHEPHVAWTTRAPLLWNYRTDRSAIVRAC